MTDSDRPWDAQQPTASRSSGDLFQRLGGNWRFWAGLVAVFAVIYVASAIWGGDADSGNSEAGAKDVCHQRVEEQLKAPATADYSDETTTQTSPGHWTVTGSVDSENSFGAKIRSSYTCTAIHNDGDNWSANASVG